MLMEAKNQIKISFLSVKYAIMKEMLNKASFFMNVIIMILNNASFIIQWVILYSLKENVGGYTFKQVLLIWGMAAGSYGLSRFFFKKAFELSDIINTGKLDSFLVQPKNVLLSTITTDVTPSALGDIIYGYIMLFIFGFTIPRFFLYTLFIICGGFITTAISVIFSSLSFWFSKTDIITDTINSLMINFGTYPDGIFEGIAKGLFYTLIPVGFVVFVPVRTITNFNIYSFLIIILVTIFLVTLAFIIFNKGLKKYSSSNLMSARI